MTEEKGNVPVKSGSREPSLFEDVWSPFARLREDMDRLFGNFIGRVGGPPSLGRGQTVDPFAAFGHGFGGALAAVDVVESDKDYRLTAELPGLDEKSAEYTLADNTLTIKGEKKDEREEKDGGYVYSERRFGSFQRSFRVPENVDRDKIEATFKNGVLTLVLPKNPAAAEKEKGGFDPYCLSCKSAWWTSS